jgi:5-methylcytosine-specific restriction endonuclease McrA
MPWKSDPDKKETGTCKACGKEFSFYKCQPRMYCSKACYHSTKPATYITANCPACDKEFTYSQAWPRVYCSNVCKGKANVSNIKKFKPSSYMTTCEECGKEYKVNKPSSEKGRFCSLQCAGKWHGRHYNGEKHGNWRGGYEPYYGPTWELARRAARERDNYTCQDCGIAEAETGKELDVHHLKRFGDFGRRRHAEANHLDNLVSLCNVCHTAREWHTTRKPS